MSVALDKELVAKKIREAIAANLQQMENAAKATFDAATHPENKAENKYDTRGLEASYLAGAQASRALELEESLAIFEKLVLRSYDEETPIGISALLLIECDNESRRYFVGPCAGGVKVVINTLTIWVITPSSPIGRTLMGKFVGDEIPVGKEKKLWEIVEIQ